MISAVWTVLRSLFVANSLFLFLDAHAQIVLQDDLQRTVTLPAPARRVVSLAPSVTETLFAIGAGDHVVGVTNYCNYPPEAQRKQRVGGIVNANIEAIVSLKPDLILMSMEGNVRTDFDRLTALGIPVFVTNPRTLEDIFSSIHRIGQLTGKRDSAQRLVQTLRARTEAILAKTRQAPKHSVLLFVSLQPLIVVGNGSFLAELLERAGGRNTAAHAPSRYPMYSREAVLKDDPDVLIFLSDVLSDSADLVRRYPEWSTLKAYRRGNVFRIEADVVSRPGPRAVEGLEALYNLLHAHHNRQD